MARIRYFIIVVGIGVILLLSSAFFWRIKVPYITTIKSGLSIVSHGTTVARPTMCENSLANSTSHWFREKVEFKTYTHWAEETLSLDKDVYKWWMKLQPRKDDNLTDAMDELFKVGVPRKVENKRPEDGTHLYGGCITCAVVGNSDILLKDRHGELIDNHTYVLRFNGAVTKEYEKYAGTKWTHLFLYPETGVSRVNKNATVILVPFKPPDLRWLASALGGKPLKFTSYAAAPSRLDCDKSKIVVLHPHFMSYVHSTWMEKKGIQPSTGLLGLIYAIHRCDKVDVFGFGANDKGQWLHYFDKDTKGGHSSHNDGAEKHVIRMLEKEGIIRFYH